MDDSESFPKAGGALSGARVRAAGDSAVVIEFGERIERALLERVTALDRHVRALAASGRLPGLVETVPTFRSLALMLDPLVSTPGELVERIRGERIDDADETLVERRVWEFPVRYGGEEGADLDMLAERAGIDADALVAHHVGTPLAVYMLGFLPGFAFLGDIAPPLRQPRRTEPRLRVPAGSVAVADALSAIYPWESPGGWHLIGHCPVPLFDAERDVPALLCANDTVCFRAIDADEHATLIEERASGHLDPERFRTTDPDATSASTAASEPADRPERPEPSGPARAGR